MYTEILNEKIKEALIKIKIHTLRTFTTLNASWVFSLRGCLKVLHLNIQDFTENPYKEAKRP